MTAYASSSHLFFCFCFFFVNATFITSQPHYLQYYYMLTTIEITYTTYNTIAYTTTCNAFTNTTRADYLLTLHVITYVVSFVDNLIFNI